jgi:hypothetical protein
VCETLERKACLLTLLPFRNSCCGSASLKE